MALYLYAICGAGSTAPDGTGLSGSELRLLECGELAALVSEHPQEMSQPAEEDLWRHERVVERLMEQRDVLPARFGTLLSDDAAVERFLREQADSLRARLQQVAGAVELGVRAVWTYAAGAADGAADGAGVDAAAGAGGRETAAGENGGGSEEAGRGGAVAVAPGGTPASGEGFIGSSRPAGAPGGRAGGLERGQSGAAYLRGRAAELARARRLARRVEAAVAEDTRESRVAVLPHPDVAISGSYLLDRERVEHFRQCIAALDAADREAQIVCTGPWPPYTFVTGGNEP